MQAMELQLVVGVGLSGSQVGTGVEGPVGTESIRW